MAYALAGADCIDVAADPAVVAVTRTALDVAEQLQGGGTRGRGLFVRPLLMVSFSDGEDPHFRKAAFDPTCCPADCSRPCERICPTQAINVADTNTTQTEVLGVLSDRCFGCGRCVAICPLNRINTYSQIASLPQLLPQLIELGIDAIEIHTQVGRLTEFTQIWRSLQPWLQQLKLIAVSCSFQADVVGYLHTLAQMIQPLHCPLIWQVDGRSMSGDLGRGTTQLTIRFAQQLLESDITGHIQLAGGTNDHTVGHLQRLGLLKTLAIPNQEQSEIAAQAVAGVGYGSYARKLLQPVLQELEIYGQPLEQVPELLERAVGLAQTLITPLKHSSPQPKPPRKPLAYSLL
ncbi:MAG: LdpA C-terminal domain-containing domain [Cyanobacteria bacterium P01_H01_bin.121]